MTATDCTKCDGWGCRGCLSLGGEQGPSLEELREERLRNRVRQLEQENARLTQVRDHVAAIALKLRCFTASSIGPRYELGKFDAYQATAIELDRALGRGAH